MVNQYQGHFNYDKDVISKWNSTALGVYYCGYITDKGGLWPLYIGKGTGNEGIRIRLLSHLANDDWPDATHFGYHLCTTSAEAENWESEEIARYKPKYNKIGK